MGVPYGWEFIEEYENFQPSKNSVNWKKARVTYRENDGIVIMSDSQFENFKEGLERKVKMRGVPLPGSNGEGL